MKRFHVASALVLFLALVAGNAQAAIQYTITDLGTLSGGPCSFATGINASGQIVGNAYISDGSYPHAFLYSGGTMQDLGTLGGTKSYANAINDSGKIVGYAYNSAGYPRAFLYSGSGPMQDLGALGGTNSFAYGINAGGQIVGCAYTSSNGGTHAFLYSGGTMKDLGTLSDASATYSNSCVFGINTAGKVVGYSLHEYGQWYIATQYSGSGPMALLDTRTLTTNYATSLARGINDNGQAIGHFWNQSIADQMNPPTPSVCHAFRTSANQVLNTATDDLGTLGGTWSYAYSINAGGTVVGAAYIARNEVPHAFIFSGTGPMQDLNSLIDPASGWILYQATGINATGSIVGVGWNSSQQQHAYLLTPK